MGWRGSRSDAAFSVLGCGWIGLGLLLVVGLVLRQQGQEQIPRPALRAGLPPFSKGAMVMGVACPLFKGGDGTGAGLPTFPKGRR